MFQNLGRMLAEFYFPEEAAQVRGHLAAPVAGVPRSEDAVAATERGALDYLIFGTVFGSSSKPK